MALEFTNIPDRTGPAVYLVGMSMLENRLTAYGQELDKATDEKTQVVYLDVRSKDGAQVADFYDIQESSLPAVLIVMDDDTIYKSWFGQDLPRPGDVAHDVKRISGHSV